MATNPNTYTHSCVQFPHQPYIAPGLSFPDNNSKFLGVFTASHLSICLLVSGFGLIVTGLLGVVTRASLDQNAFHAVGIALICFGSVLIVIAISVFIFAIRWGRKRVHVLERQNVSNYPNIPISLMPIGYSLPLFPNSNNNFDALQQLQNGSNFQNFITTQTPNQSFYSMPVPNNSSAGAQHFVVIQPQPTAPPQSADSVQK